MSLKKIINIMLIGFLVFSNLALSPALAEQDEENETQNKEVTLYIPDLEELIIYENKELTEELAHIQNNSSAILLEDEDTSSSLVEVETQSKEKVTGYIQTEAVVKEELAAPEKLEEYKLYAETEADTVQVYSDELLKDELYKLADGTSVLVNKIDLESALEREEEFIFISLNPEIETIPDELKDEIKDIKEIQGFVKIDHLISLEDEAVLLEKRNEEKEKQEQVEEKQEETKEIEEEQEKDESEEKQVEREKQKETKDNEKVDQSEKETSEAEKNAESELEEQKENTPSMFRSNIQETQTSLLAHINSGTGKIYKTLGETPFEAGSAHTNKVYYVKKQTTYENELYYLMSLNSKATNNLGWMKASDVKVQQHTFINRTSDKLSIKGNGKGTRMAWGGKKDTIHASMSSYKGEILHVNMKETVGTTTWYRGKIAGEGANVWLKENQVDPIQIKETPTSLLGHINSGNGDIYKTLGESSFKAGATYTNKVYYVKKQATYGNELYYLLSLNSKATNNLGWMKASDVKVQKHTFINRTSEKLSIKGNGKGTRMAWGGKKDTVHASMSSHKGKILHVNMKETVGTTTWYRGKIAGKGVNVWVSENQVEPIKIKETPASLLGHINSGNGDIYKTLGESSFKAGSAHTNKVYYVKKQATYGNELYYLLSLNSKATNNLGWMKASDVKVKKHTFINRTADKVSIKGNGKGTRMAWGGKKDTIHTSMSSHKGKILHVNMKETVGTTTWYRGKIAGKGANVWLSEVQVSTNLDTITHTDYGLSVNAAVALQLERGPFVMNGSHGFIAKSLVNQNNTVKVNSNVRTMPQTAANRDNKIITSLKAGTKIKPIGEIGAWYAIEVGGSRKVTALANQIKNRLDPKNSVNHSVNRFQFLDLRKRTGLSVAEMNRELATRGVLQGEGEAFRTASITHGINEMYLIVHARLETGNGTSALSNGTYEVGLNKSGKPELVTASNRLTLTNIKKTYNMFGIGAIDTDPGRGGAITAYNEGWFTPSAAIIGGAAWIKDSYIYNEHNQNTLYKMRWNPNMVNGYAWKQYATDIDWALKQAVLMQGVYSHTDKNKALTFDLPTYR